MTIARRFGDWAGARWYIGGSLFTIYLTAIILGAVSFTGAWWLLPFAIGLATGATVVVVVAVARDPDKLDTRLHRR